MIAVPAVLLPTLALSRWRQPDFRLESSDTRLWAIFRAPFAGAVLAAEVLYREPDIEDEVQVPALLSSIVS